MRHVEKFALITCFVGIGSIGLACSSSPVPSTTVVVNNINPNGSDGGSSGSGSGSSSGGSGSGGSGSGSSSGGSGSGSGSGSSSGSSSGGQEEDAGADGAACQGQNVCGAANTTCGNVVDNCGKTVDCSCADSTFTCGTPTLVDPSPFIPKQPIGVPNQCGLGCTLEMISACEGRGTGNRTWFCNAGSFWTSSGFGATYPGCGYYPNGFGQTDGGVFNAPAGQVIICCP